MTDCPICSSALPDPLPPACPECGNDISATSPAPITPATVAAAAAPSVAAPGPASGCATEGCGGTAVPGDTLCPTCRLLHATTGTFRLEGTWGAVDVPTGATVVLGREPALAPVTALALTNAGWVSREHAVVTSSAGRLTLTDVGSRHGTTVNGCPVDPGTPQELLAGDVVVLGNQVQYVVRLMED